MSLFDTMHNTRNTWLVNCTDLSLVINKYQYLHGILYNFIIILISYVIEAVLLATDSRNGKRENRFLSRNDQ